MELPPACQEPRWVPHSRGVSRVNIFHAVRPGENCWLQGRETEKQRGLLEIGTWQAGFRVRREARVAASQH